MSRDADILIVCTGNICRSPYVEYRLRQLIDPSISVASAGTGALVDHAIAPRVRRMLARAGITDTSPFRARQVGAELVAAAGLVLTATEDHRSVLAALAPGHTGHVFTLGQFARLTTVTSTADRGTTLGSLALWADRYRYRTGPRSPEDDLPDPWGRSAIAYSVMRRRAEPMVQAVVQVLQNLDA